MSSFDIRLKCDCGYWNTGVWHLKSLHYEADGIPTLTVRLPCEKCNTTIERVIESPRAK